MDAIPKIQKLRCGKRYADTRLIETVYSAELAVVSRMDQQVPSFVSRLPFLQVRETNKKHGVVLKLSGCGCQVAPAELAALIRKMLNQVRSPADHVSTERLKLSMLLTLFPGQFSLSYFTKNALPCSIAYLHLYQEQYF